VDGGAGVKQASVAWGSRTSAAVECSSSQGSASTGPKARFGELMLPHICHTSTPPTTASRDQNMLRSGQRQAPSKPLQYQRWRVCQLAQHNKDTGALLPGATHPSGTLYGMACHSGFVSRHLSHEGPKTQRMHNPAGDSGASSGTATWVGSETSQQHHTALNRQLSARDPEQQPSQQARLSAAAVARAHMLQAPSSATDCI
jgi:hypothetical protein